MKPIRPEDYGRTPDLFTCPDCHDAGWVCELHEHQPQGHDGCGGAGAICRHPRCIFRGAPYHVRDDDRPMAPHCFLYEAGVGAGEPCWGTLTIVPGIIQPDEGGGTPGDVMLCEGHLPVGSGEPYRPEPKR